jgi:hypothetical protein
VERRMAVIPPRLDRCGIYGNCTAGPQTDHFEWLFDEPAVLFRPQVFPHLEEDHDQ